MFWRTLLEDSESINALLQKQDLKLQEILDDPFALQEVKSENPKLLEFLGRPEVLSQLLQHCLTEPSCINTTPEKKYKYSHLSTEILCAGAQHFLSNLATCPSSMDSLSSFLNSERLNPLLASYFCRIFSLLVQHHSDQVMQLLMRDTNFLSMLEKHVEVSSIAEAIIHLCTYVEDREKSKHLSKLLDDAHLLENLVALVRSSRINDVSDSATFVLIELIRTFRDSMSNNDEDSENFLVDKINSLEFLHGFINLFALTENSLCNMLNILLTLLSTLPGSLWQTETDVFKMAPENLTLYTKMCYHPERFSLASGSLSIYFCDKLIELVDLLKVDVSKVKNGKVAQNSKRKILIAKILLQLVSQHSSSVHNKIVTSRILYVLLENFANCHQSNLLISHILFVVYFSLNATVVDDKGSYKTSVIVAHLFEDGFLLRLILREYENVKKQKFSSFRGHLMKLAEIVSGVLKNGPNVDLIKMQLKSTSPVVIMSWVDFEQTDLRDFIAKNQPDKVGLEPAGKIDLMQDDASASSLQASIFNDQVANDENGFPVHNATVDSTFPAESENLEEDFEKFCASKTSDLSFEEEPGPAANTANDWTNQEEDFNFFSSRGRTASSSSSNDSGDGEVDHKATRVGENDEQLWADFDFPPAPSPSNKTVAQQKRQTIENDNKRAGGMLDEFDPFFTAQLDKVDALPSSSSTTPTNVGDLRQENWANFDAESKKEEGNEWPGVLGQQEASVKHCAATKQIGVNWADFGVQ